MPAHWRDLELINSVLRNLGKVARNNMQKVNRRFRLFTLIISLFLAAALCFFIDSVLAFCAISIRVRTFLIIVAVLSAGVIWFSSRREKALYRAFLLTTVLLAAGWLTVRISHKRYNNPVVARETRYADVETGKEALYSGKRVMLIVPHEDDDLNVLGGVTEEYVRHGSEVFVVFMTNGDYHCAGEVRITEAIELYRYLGVPEDHIIFLGYGDTMGTENYHIYNAPLDEIITSSAEKSATYALDTHPPFRSDHPYTLRNLMKDMKDVILEKEPELIYCVDYDRHWDHKACSLIFDRVMGEILKERQDYSPAVFKGYGYSTAWYAQYDFFEPNIRSTLDFQTSLFGQQPEVYRWSERVRLPVLPGSLSRSLPGSELYTELGYYASQVATDHAAAVINGDKVFWKRSTDSLARNASVSASSGDAARLTDFMILDTDNLLDLGHLPCDGAWVPDEEDPDKTAFVELASLEDVYAFVLYDNPSESDNILNALVTFDNGSSFETGPLDAGGAATRFFPNAQQVRQFQITILKAEGSCAGITEVEAFTQPAPQIPTFLKIMDTNEDFAYDYQTDRDGKAVFLLFSDGVISDLDHAAYEVTCEGNHCSASFEEGTLVVQLAKGEVCKLSVRLKTGDLSDTIIVRNPLGSERFRQSCQLLVENFYAKNHYLLFLEKMQENLYYATKYRTNH